MKKEMYRLADENLERLNSRLIYATVSAALLYLVVCIWQALKVSTGAEHIDAALSVNPRSIIVLCGVAAAIGVAFMPEIGKILAALALLAVVALFGYWGYVTSVIKANLRITEFSQAGFSGNWFIGATLFDLATLVVAVVLVVYDVRVIYRNFQARAGKGNLLRVEPPPAVMAK